MRHLGTIFISIFILIGLFLVPINAVFIAEPSYYFGIDGNLLTPLNLVATNCTASYISNSGQLKITTSGDGQPFSVYLASNASAISLPAGDYKFGLVLNSYQYSFLSISYGLGGSSITSSTSSSDTFTLDSPSVCSVVIKSDVGSDDLLNSSFTFFVRPYLIFNNDSSSGIVHAFTNSISGFFSSLKNGFLFISDSLIGVDKLPTNLGYIFLITLGFILCLYLLDLIFKFICNILHGRR